jgi:hypothetical protein
MNIRPVETELFRVDGQTDIKLIVAFATLRTRLKTYVVYEVYR